MKSQVAQASVPAALGGTGFQPVRRTGKMPVPPGTFQNSSVGRASVPATGEMVRSAHPTKKLVPFPRQTF
jgi:hypothetical protein